MNLFEISASYQQIFHDLDENGEINPDALARLSALDEAMDAKAIAIACYIKNIDAERNAIEAAKRSMALREATLDRKISSLESYLQTNMERCGITEITRSPFFTIKLKKCPVSVDILDAEALPTEYIKEKMTTSIDKVKIKEEIMAGVIVPGAALKQNLRLEIK